jgi:hypothetical protein
LVRMMRKKSAPYRSAKDKSPAPTTCKGWRKRR